MNIWRLYNTLWQGDKKKEGEKKVFSFKVYTKVEYYLKKNWGLVFSFMYLVLVDAMDWSYVEKNLALQAQSLLWRLNLFANEDSNFGSMFLEFE